MNITGKLLGPAIQECHRQFRSSMPDSALLLELRSKKRSAPPAKTDVRLWLNNAYYEMVHRISLVRTVTQYQNITGSSGVQGNHRQLRNPGESPAAPQSRKSPAAPESRKSPAAPESRESSAALRSRGITGNKFSFLRLTKRRGDFIDVIVRNVQ